MVRVGGSSTVRRILLAPVRACASRGLPRCARPGIPSGPPIRRSPPETGRSPQGAGRRDLLTFYGVLDASSADLSRLVRGGQRSRAVATAQRRGAASWFFEAYICLSPAASLVRSYHVHSSTACGSSPSTHQRPCSPRTGPQTAAELRRRIDLRRAAEPGPRLEKDDAPILWVVLASCARSPIGARCWKSKLVYLIEHAARVRTGRSSCCLL